MSGKEGIMQGVTKCGILLPKNICGLIDRCMLPFCDVATPTTCLSGQIRGSSSTMGSCPKKNMSKMKFIKK